MRDRQASARFGVVVYDGVEPIDLGGTVGVVSMATRVLPAVEAVVIAARPGPVQLAGGLAVTAAFGFADAPACDRIIVCGGATWPTQAKDADMLAFLRHQSPGTLASVCTGAMILAAAGLLDGHAATTRRHRIGTETISPLEVMASLAPKALPTAALIIDDVVVTGGGVSLAIDTTLYLLGSVFGTQAQQEVAAVIEYDRAYEANRSALGVRGRQISQFTPEPAATSDIDSDKVDERCWRSSISRCTTAGGRGKVTTGSRWAGFIARGSSSIRLVVPSQSR